MMAPFWAQMDHFNVSFALDLNLTALLKFESKPLFLECGPACLSCYDAAKCIECFDNAILDDQGSCSCLPGF